MKIFSRNLALKKFVKDIKNIDINYLKKLTENTGSGYFELPKITVLVPCFNSRATLPATLKSIQQSDYKNLEVIIVDDGSVDTIEDIVSKIPEDWLINESDMLSPNEMRNAYIEYLNSRLLKIDSLVKEAKDAR